MSGLTPAQEHRRKQKETRRRALERDRSINRAQNVKDKEAADLRRRAAAVPGTDRAPAIARAFRAVQAGRAS